MKDKTAPVLKTAEDGKEKKITHILQFLLIVCIAVFVDQLTKYIDFYFLPENGDRLWLIDGVFGFSHVENDAIAFGIGSGNHAFMVAVMVVTAVLMAAIPVVAFKVFPKNVPAQVCLAFIEGGAIGNFIDRLLIRNGQGVAVVRDFINLEYFGFANCNIADFCVTFGAAALIVILLFIGPQAAFPLKKKWRAQAKREDEKKEGSK